MNVLSFKHGFRAAVVGIKFVNDKPILLVRAELSK